MKKLLWLLIASFAVRITIVGIKKINTEVNVR